VVCVVRRVSESARQIRLMCGRTNAFDWHGVGEQNFALKKDQPI
jgi:hypothetical protein